MGRRGEGQRKTSSSEDRILSEYINFYLNAKFFKRVMTYKRKKLSYFLKVYCLRLKIINLKRYLLA